MVIRPLTVFAVGQVSSNDAAEMLPEPGEHCVVLVGDREAVAAVGKLLREEVVVRAVRREEPVATEADSDGRVVRHG